MLAKTRRGDSEQAGKPAAERPCDASEALFGLHAGLGLSILQGTQHEILERLDIVWIHRFWADAQTHDVTMTIHRHGHDTTTGRPLEANVLETFLGTLQVFLHLLGLSHHLAQVHASHAPGETARHLAHGHLHPDEAMVADRGMMEGTRGASSSSCQQKVLSLPATPEQMHLVHRALGGDKQAFEILVEPSLDRLYALARAHLGDPDDAADVLQDALLKAYRGLGTFRGTSDVHGWLCRIVRNTVLDEFKKASRRHEEPVEQVPERPDRSLDRAFEDQQLGEVVREAVDQLSDKLKGPLLLYDLEGYDYQEIATMLDLNLGTVKSRLNRARESLRQILLARKDRWSAWLEGKSHGLPTG